MQSIKFFGTTGCETSSGSAPAIIVSREAFGGGSAWPIRPGWRDVRDRMKEVEADPVRRQGLIEARKRLAQVVSTRRNLTVLRLERGFSRRDLAALSSIPEAVLCRVEAGIEDPRLSVCRGLARALERSIEEVVAAIAASGPSEPEHDPRVDVAHEAARPADASSLSVDAPTGRK